jgi:phage-related protein|tara:strand:+ start:342 stop:674 length:333 start_codon:yes stop_codon:yes gene_type:complete
MDTRKLVVSDAVKRAFNKLPKDVQEDFAKALQDVVNERKPSMVFKPLNDLGKNVKGVMELVINGSPAYRAVYLAKFNNKVYLLHAFTKTTNGVDRKAMDLVVKRYKEIPK